MKSEGRSKTMSLLKIVKRAIPFLEAWEAEGLRALMLSDGKRMLSDGGELRTLIKDAKEATDDIHH